MPCRQNKTSPRSDLSAWTARPMPVYVVWASGLRRTYAIIRAFETGKPIMGP